MNFGLIKNIFASRLVESQLSGDKTGKDLYKKFIKTITENEILKSQFIVYKNIENRHFNSEVTASDYLKENISILQKYRKQDINNANKVLLGLLEGMDMTTTTTNNELYESIHTLITNKKSASTINKLHESFETAKNWLLTEKVKEEKSVYVKEGVNVDKFLNLVVGKYNDKYSDISEEEKYIIKVLRENDESCIKVLVGELVKENIDLINLHLVNYGGNVEMKSKLLDTKDTIYRMVEDNGSFSDKVLRLYELKDSLKNG